MKPERLYKTTVTIWTAYDPSDSELANIGYAADNGDAFCSYRDRMQITDPERYPDTDIFDLPDPEPDPFPKPWKVGFRPVEGATVYDLTNNIVPWDLVTNELNSNIVFPKETVKELSLWDWRKGYENDFRKNTG